MLTVVELWRHPVKSMQGIAAVAGQRSTYQTPTDPFDGEHDWASWQGPEQSFVDSTRTAVSLITTTTLRSWDHRRFRMNVVLAGADENDLVGQRIRLGTATLDVVKRVDRCVMVTRAQPGIDRDLDVLKSIIRDHDGDLGIGAIVIEPGVVQVGDLVEFYSPE
jgi:uncharacterized protein